MVVPRWPHPRSFDGGVDRIPVSCVTGQLWLAGKHAIGPDPERALRHLEATTIVCLNQRHELLDRYPAYVDWLAAQPPERVVWFPIPDLDAPPFEVVRPLLVDLGDRLRRGERLIVHCAAGIGRSGTIAVCLLMTLGFDRVDALRVVATHRPMAGPEVGAQGDLVNQVASSLAG